jgi:hypothetical protein
VVLDAERIVAVISSIQEALEERLEKPKKDAGKKPSAKGYRPKLTARIGNIKSGLNNLRIGQTPGRRLHG